MGISFLAGETIRAGKLSRVQPTTFRAVGAGTLAAGSTNAAITSASVTFTTLQPNALYTAVAVFDVDMTGASTALFIGKMFVDGVPDAVFATYAGEVATDRSTVSQTYRGTLATAASHTLDLRATTGANQTVVGIHSTLLVTVYEQA